MNDTFKKCLYALAFIGLTSSITFAHCCGDSAGSSGAFVLSPQIYWLDAGPLDGVAQKEETLKDKTFHFQRHNPLFLLGLGGYHDHGNGFRSGFSVYGGYKSYYSDIYKNVVAGAASRDSVTVLRFIPAYGGFTFDKSARYGDIGFSGGVMIGGGVFMLNRESYDVDRSSAFSSYEPRVDTVGREPSDEHDWAFAGNFAFDAHAGMTFRLSPLLHLGIDAIALCFYSPEGFGYASGEFFTVNPGVRIRLIVGRAG